MSNQSITTSIFKDKLKHLSQEFKKHGMSRTVSILSEYIRYNLTEKWRFIFFEINLTSPPLSLPKKDESILIRRAKIKDHTKIKNDLYPYMDHKYEFDKKYIDKIGETGINCFIAEVDNKVIHYFMVFNSAIDSPLVQTPFDKKMINKDDAYLGNAFTIPSARGKWITPYVVLAIIKYLQNETNATRALLLVHEDTPGAVGFFNRLGFKVIENAYPKTYLSRFLTGK
jgi:ribosomal protein S18 acetylase RimI-like enzyme